jgi:pimeloyl-ACP methyl ester carboxylesterase
MPFFDYETTKVYYTDSGATASNDSPAPAIVFVHGLTSSSKIYSRQIAYFSKTHRVIAFDFLGHGFSYRPSLETVDHSIEGQTNILVKLLDHLHVSRITLVAWSLGGFIASEYAHRYPEKVEALVMVGTAAMFVSPSDEDTSFPAHPPSTFKAWLSMWTAQSRPLGTAFVFSQYPESTPTDYPEYVAEALQDTWSVETEAVLATMTVVDHRPYYPEFKARVLFIHGDKDANVKIEAAKWGYDAVQTDKKLVIYENTGHVPHVSNANQFNRDVAAFLQV